MLRRIVPIAVIVSLLSAICPTPAWATSTTNEVEMGRVEDQQIVESSVIETDPLLNAYVNGIASNLWKQVDRKDVPYNLKIIHDPEVNSFATMGGYVYINEGLIDFVNSDDELAGVIGHETGHIERRHVLTLQSKANILSLLVGIVAMFSPFVYQFGNLMQAGAIAKMQRGDELQADRTGLQLMARAGYDPDAMKTMLEHLNVLEADHSDLVTKYLEDHPGPEQRVGHLDGYPELDPKVVTEQQLLVQAASDAERARYSYSSLKFADILKTDPSNSEALLGLGQDQLALGLTSKSQQTLAQAATQGTTQSRGVAQQRILALQKMESRRINFAQPNLDLLRDKLLAAQATQTQANAQIAARRDEARDQLKQLTARFEALTVEVPQYQQIQHNSRLETVMRNIAAMGRSISSAMSDASTTIGGVGSLDKGKESGMLHESATILDEMQNDIDARPIPPDTLGVLPNYPSMFNELQHADSDMIRSVDASRASLTLLDNSLGDLDAFLKDLAHANFNFQGDISQTEYQTFVPQMQKLVTNLSQAAAAASQANQLYNMARTRQLSTQITLLGVGTTPQRYATLQYALQKRFNLDGIDYITMLKDGLTPGDVTVATIAAADTRSTTQEIVDQMLEDKQSPVDVADGHGVHAWPMEIFTGLMYLDYTDNPVTELHPE